RFPDGDGISEIAALRERCPQVSVLILTASTAVDVLAAAFHAGAAGFVTKTEPAEHLLDAVRRVARGEAAFGAEDLTRLANYLATNGTVEVDPLTAREHEVLAGLARGRTTTQLAEDLVLSQHTVRNHVRSILSKLGARSKLEAVLIAVRRGLVTLD
ncbi:MAG: LuxR C-terminal-related transcriptional regulator, partial [Nitriliruptoraceae bacterium]